MNTSLTPVGYYGTDGQKTANKNSWDAAVE